MNGHQRQKEQSGRMIEDALFFVMRNKPYAEITISDISKQADLSRRTFYRLYHEKDDVLHRYFDRLCKEYCSQMPPLQKYDIGQIAREYFSFWYQYRENLLIMHQCGLDEMLYYEISRASKSVVEARIGSETQKNDKDIGYFADYSAGGFSLLLHRWIAEGMQEPPEQYAQSVSRSLLTFIRPVLY